MAAPSHVTVINDGAAVTVGGISFSSGNNVIRAETLDALVALGLVNADETPLLRFDLAYERGTAPASVVFTLSASGSVV